MKQFAGFYRAILIPVWVLVVLSLGACADAPAQDDSAAVVAPGTVVKSPNDKREYRALTLDNGLKVVLVSDPETEKAAAAVDVNAGSNSDPAEFPGLAHFLEHMLFLGTTGYPEAGEYQEYIASHGGSNNAYTAYENTNYYFDIDSPYLEPALDRFAQFFTAPLFTPEYVERERNAVHSEYQSGLQDDSRRGYSALKNLMNPRHPLARFSVGSLETLQDRDALSLRAALLQQYDRYYSANLMSVALIGRETLDELEVLARRYFSGVENRDRSAPLTSAPLFTDASLPALLEISPVRDTRALTFTFPIPVVAQHYQSKPLEYLGSVLGHEGEGSLLALLRQKGWANGLSAGGGFSYPDTATFTVNVALTEEGVAHVDEISALVFQFIELVRTEGVQEWLFDELRVMSALSFQFQEAAAPQALVGSLARRLQEYPAAELITAPYAYTQFDAVLLQDILAQLQPENVLLTFTARGVETDSTDVWYGTPYRHSTLPAERLQAWAQYPKSDQLAISAPNPFLPENLALKPYQGAAPTVAADQNSAALKPDLLVDAGGVRLWFKQDAEFLAPRANFFVYGLTPLFSESLRSSLLSAFAVSLVNDQLNEFAYPANLAGSFFGLSARSRGFSLSVSGYSDKQALLLEELLKTLSAADFEQERFDIIKAEMVRSWQNAALQTPYIRLFDEVQALLIEPYWPEAEKIAAIQQLTLQDVKDFIPQLLSGLRLDVLYHGNVVPDDALAMLEVLTRYLHADAAAPLPDYGTVVKMPEATRVVQELELDHDDSAIVIYRQGTDDSLQTRALDQLLGTMLATPFYDTLRTEQQLGYIVNAGAFSILDTSGLIMYIEAPATDPLVLESSIDAFLAAYVAQLEQMDPAMFDGIKAGLLTSLREAPQRLNALSNRYWSDILIGEFEQDSTLELADAIAALTLEQVTTYYREHVATAQGRLVARSAGRGLRPAFVAARAEGVDAVILDEGFADYRPFKQAAPKYEFR